MATLNYQTRQEIVAQSLKEIQFARDFKQGKIANWKLNEDLYYGRKLNNTTARANVDLGLMQSHIHTILSKIDNPLVFKFTKRKNSQIKRVTRLNALRAYDAQIDYWDIKDLVGKKQAAIYGRAIYFYYADSVDGYKAHLEPCDVYDFLIDPSAGGIDIEAAMYLGRYGVVKTRAELKEGMRRGIYLRTETSNLLGGDGNSTEMTQEEINKLNRTVDQNVWSPEKNIGNKDVFKFWQWFTTYDGKRYVLTLQEKAGTAIEIRELTDIFPANRRAPLGAWPVWTWAAFPDLTEFWTPSFADYVRETFMAQGISINQMLDNAEQINKPQRAFSINAIDDLATLKYRRDGLIPIKDGYRPNESIYELRPTSINTPIQVFQLLDGIQGKNSGVTDAAKGVADEDKVGIYQGNQENTADRFGLLNKSYSFGYQRFAFLYDQGVRTHLTKKTAVDIMGPDGIEIEEISRADIYRKNDEFGTLVEASNAELALSVKERETKLAFLTAESQNPTQNQQKAYEIKASIAGFDDDTIRQLMDTSEFGDAAIMSEADRDIEAILDGKKIPVNPGASIAYKQRFVDYIRKNREEITIVQFDDLTNYIDQLDPVITQNMERILADMAFKNALQSGGAPVEEENINKVVTDEPPNGEVAPVEEELPIMQQ